jgi:hypothetical protein
MAADYLIDQLLPTSRLNLIGGNSNVGKTRFLLPMLLDWQAGCPIMGFPTNPVPWAYVVGDRLLVEAHDTCKTMGIDPKRIPMIPAFGEHNKSYRAVLKEAETRKLGFLLWEGFADFCDGERKKEIRDFMSTISAYCHMPQFFNASLTILGVMESPKLKPHETYSDPRQRISGAAGWGYHASSVLLIESVEPTNLENPNRIMHCSVKNGISFSIGGAFNPLGQLRFLNRLDSSTNSTRSTRKTLQVQ